MMDRSRRCVECVCAVVARNPATARLLGLCPLLAVSNTTLKAIALGIILGLVVIISAGVASAFRYCVSWRLKPMYHALIASFATAGVVAYASIENYELVAAMGIYPVLIASNCLVLSFMQEVAERNRLAHTLKRGVRDIVFVVGFLGLFGAVRELAAYGSIFTDWGLVEAVRPAGVVTPHGPFPLMAGAPGALLTLALLLAGANAISRRYGDPGIKGSVVETAGPQALSAVDAGSGS